jgi:hypothetical protein
MDKACWHIAGDLVVPENLSLAFLPRYSPRENRHSHCVLQTTGEIIDTCCDAWEWMLDQTGRLRSLCSYPSLELVSN